MGRKGRKKGKHRTKSVTSESAPNQNKTTELDTELQELEESQEVSENRQNIQGELEGASKSCEGEEKDLNYDNEDYIILFYYAIKEMEKLIIQIDRTNVPMNVLLPNPEHQEIYKYASLYCKMKRENPDYLKDINDLETILDNVYTMGVVHNLTQYTVGNDEASEALGVLRGPSLFQVETTRPKESSSEWASKSSRLTGEDEAAGVSHSSSTDFSEELLGAVGGREEDDELFEDARTSESLFTEFQEERESSSDDEDLTEDNTIHILQFVYRQTRDMIQISFHVPNISKHTKDQIQLQVEEQSVIFYAGNLRGKSYIFQISNLYAKINPSESKYEAQPNDVVYIMLKKKKYSIWKGMDLIPKDAQIKWLSEMSNILCDIPEEFKTDEIMENLIWKNSVRMENSSIDLLNPPASIFENFNYTFNTLDELVACSKEMAKSHPYRQEIMDLIGAVVLRKIRFIRDKKPVRKLARIKSSTATYTEDKHKPPIPAKSKPLFPKLKEFSKYSEEDDRITMEALQKFNEAKECYGREMYNEAVTLLTEAINLKGEPNYFRLRCKAHFRLQNFLASYLDGKSVLRLSGIIDGSDCLVLCGESEILVGNPVCAINLILPSTRILCQINQNDQLALREVITGAQILLPSIIMAIDHIMNGKVRSAVKHMEKAVSLSVASSGLSVQVTLLYLLCGDYETARNMAKYLISKVPKIPLPYYILGKCLFYLGERNNAVGLLKQCIKVRRNKLAIQLLKKIKRINTLIEDGDKAFANKHFQAAHAHYSNALKVEPKNFTVFNFILEKIEQLPNREGS